MIKNLSQTTAEELCAQQVITSLPDIVKQLIDNSLDAKATYIKVQLQEYGKKAIEVTDNGMGIHNFDFLGKKGSTSKNKGNDRFDYLGFRGQAVHSIGRVSGSMIIESKCSQDGFRRLFNLSTNTCQQFKEERLCHGQFNFKLPNREGSRNTGTKVSIESIFQRLPVRQIELISKHKQFFKKTNELIKQFCLIYPEVQFILTNTREGKEEVVIETVSHRQFNRNTWLLRIKELDQRIGNNLVYISSALFQGFVLNKIESGSSRDNLFIKRHYHYLFVNRRPVDIQPAVLTALNQIYKKYNSATKYAFVINLKLDHSDIDVNLAPNKREIFIRKKTLESIVEGLKASIGQQVIEDVPTLANFQERKGQTQKVESSEQSLLQHYLTQQENQKKQSSDKPEQNTVRLQPQVDKKKLFINKTDKTLAELPLIPRINIDLVKIKQRLNAKLSMPIRISRRNSQNDIQPPVGLEKDAIQQDCPPQVEDASIRKQQQLNLVRQQQQDAARRAQFLKEVKLQSIQNELYQNNTQKSYSNVQSYKLSSSKKKRQKHSDSAHDQKSQSSATKNSSKNNLIEQQIRRTQQMQQRDASVQIQESKEHEDFGRPQYIPKHDLELQNRIKSKLKVDMSQIFNNFTHKIEQQRCQLSNASSKAQIYQHQLQDRDQRPDSAKQINQSQVPKQLQQFCVKNLKKEHFGLFEVIGQFNLGFILCLFNRKCYLVDQHASSEKYFYEKFIHSTKFDSISNFEEKDISTIQADQIEEAKPFLNAAGFHYEIIDRTYLKLTRCPLFLQKKLGMDFFMDIVEQKRQLSRISRFTDMCAMKACRTATKVGDVLNRTEMGQLVTQLAHLESPWNCPHGRPTVIELGHRNMFTKQLRKDVIYHI